MRFSLMNGTIYFKVIGVYGIMEHSRSGILAYLFIETVMRKCIMLVESRHFLTYSVTHVCVTGAGVGRCVTLGSFFLFSCLYACYMSRWQMYNVFFSLTMYFLYLISLAFSGSQIPFSP